MKRVVSGFTLALTVWQKTYHWRDDDYGCDGLMAIMWEQHSIFALIASLNHYIQMLNSFLSLPTDSSVSYQLSVGLRMAEGMKRSDCTVCYASGTDTCAISRG